MTGRRRFSLVSETRVAKLCSNLDLKFGFSTSKKADFGQISALRISIWLDDDGTYLACFSVISWL